MGWELATFPAELMGDVPAPDGVEVEVVRGGDPVRITHVLDAVEPRVRPDGRAAFPTDGPAGQGRTNRLDGVVVLSCLDFPAEERPLHEQESVIDLAGPGAELTPFAQATNVVLTFRPRDGLGNEELEAWARTTTLAVAEDLARPTLAADPVDLETFERGPADASLPSVAALIQLSDLGPALLPVPLRRAGRAGRAAAFDRSGGAPRRRRDLRRVPLGWSPQSHHRVPAQRARARALSRARPAAAVRGRRADARLRADGRGQAASRDRRSRGGRRPRRRRRRRDDRRRR